MWRRRSDSYAHRRNSAFNEVGTGPVGKSAGLAEIRKYFEASAEEIVSVNRLPRKPAKHIVKVPVPQTDTGSQGEDPEVLE